MAPRNLFIAMVLTVASVIMLGAQARATEPAQSVLDNTIWTLALIEGEPPVEGRGDLDLQFADDGAFAVGFGCNRFRGRAEIGDAQIAFPDQIAGTMMACAEAVAAQEERVLALLAAVATFRVEPASLTLMDEAGTEMLRYVRTVQTDATKVDTSG
ncbi:META domain-containing protein [Tritonibacter horizontis]|uniref:Heat-inducible protein n=1 Tax=Tritonibacter horizontis TaxID=1768241 RepID=A0A132BRW2_9RHOB|nr:META domain-containing protein [Tritonibacter horizontis]KUP90946.1 heat-inducible protein [Tritonibacter horizontis]